METTMLHIEDLNPVQLEEYHALDATPFGFDLAQKVAVKLPHTSGLYHAHRDYCGVGLYYLNGGFELGKVYDGMGPYPVWMRFDTNEAFVDWLALQSNRSCSLLVSSGDSSVDFVFNNQTLTQLRLRYFLESFYNPNWNSYCLYIREQQ